MENASKALLIAGGMLIALLIIGALVLMFNQIGDYEKGQQSIEKTSQIAEFNMDFVRYTEDNIKGVDIISLANKVINFNSKNTISNSIDHNKKITLNIELTGFNTLFNDPSEPSCSSYPSYEVKDSNNGFMKVIKKFYGLENTYTLSNMSKLSSNYDSLEKNEKTIKDIIGKDASISLDDIKKYVEYSEFKTSTFKNKEGPTYYDNGQIRTLSFKFVKR